VIGPCEAVRERAASAPRRRCVLLEWIDPPFSSGHWGPELVEIAGGVKPIGRREADSVAIPWAGVVEAAPGGACPRLLGYSVERTRADLPILQSYPGFDGLPAAQHGEVYMVDGSAYFSRPGPRIADSLEILAEICIRRAFAVSFPTARSHALSDRPYSGDKCSQSPGYLSPLLVDNRAEWTAWGRHGLHLSGEMSVGDSLSTG
jgi:hypothetical protein